MAGRRSITKRAGDATADRLADLLIVQLGLAGVAQHTIRRIVGCDMKRVVFITKELKSKRSRADG